MPLTLPALSLVVLVGPSGSGKSTFARRHFLATEVVSSDFCRGAVGDDENDQSATADAFDVLHYIAGKRLARGLLTVVDATNVRREDRASLVALAREHDVLPTAILFNLPDAACQERNAGRADRDLGPHVVRNQALAMRRSLRGLRREGFRQYHILTSAAQVEAAQIERQPLWTDRRGEAGPFDIIGDIHGCYDELVALLEKLGYQLDGGSVVPPPGRQAIFLGDLVDRGPDSPAVLRLVMSMVAAGTALCVPGNHDVKLMRKLRGKDVQVNHGLAETLGQLERESEAFKSEVADFIDSLISHFVLDAGRLVVAHAGMKQRYIGRASGRVRDFALYGETTGETDSFGLPERLDWAADYRGPAAVVYGHTPVPAAEWLNGTINLDTGCVFGGKLAALRWPERELVSVEANRAYAESAKPFLPEAESSATAQQAHDDLLDLSDVSGKRRIETRLRRGITVRAENAAAALEVMSRFAADPRWLIYLPPTMSPCATSRLPGLLEHPAEAFGYFRENGVEKVVCQEKHMGSRAVLTVCRDAASAAARFGVEDGKAGIVVTRTGRPFFTDAAEEAALLEVVRNAVTAGGWWERFETDWVCLDAELMPWSAKAQELLRQQYAAVGSAATAALALAESVLGEASARQPELAELRDRTAARRAMAADYVAAYGQYCWPVSSVNDLKLAPFHLLAAEGRTFFDRDHLWHMATLAELAAADSSGVVVETNCKMIDLCDPTAEAGGVGWWEELTGRGGEGMVVKPLEFVVTNERGLVQPAVKCRGREYLRIIYGPEYTAPANLERLRSRGLARKRGLAVSEFALGVEALERFVRREPLRRVHECVFAVLAMESEPVDPRL